MLKEPYTELPDAEALLKAFPSFPDRDHNAKFRAVAICATTSLLADDSEATPRHVFLAGYSCAAKLQKDPDRYLDKDGTPRNAK